MSGYRAKMLCIRAAKLLSVSAKKIDVSLSVSLL